MLYRSPIHSPVRSPIYSPLTGTFGLTGTIADFPYDINFVAGTAKGGIQPYGNNNNDGRFFRDSGVSQAAFIPDATLNAVVSTASAGMRRSSKGTPGFPNIGTLGLWNRDLTNAVWVSGGGGVTTAKTQTGVDGTANAATLLTASAANGTLLQTTTATVNTRVFEAWVKRITGTGPLDATLDGGTTWQSITSQVPNDGLYHLVVISQAAVTNPVYGFRIQTSGDQIAVDLVNCHGTVNGASITGHHYVTITSSNPGSIFHETPWALNTDAGPLSSIIKGAYAVYWQGYNYVPNAGGLWVSDGVTSGQLIAGNNVTLAANVNLNTTGGEWRTGENTNKVVAWLDASGNMALCVNGGTVYTRTGGSLSPSATHFVLSNNGAATLPLCGWTERFAMGANLTFTAAQMQAMTT
jgi:hypothetical protein